MATFEKMKVKNDPSSRSNAVHAIFGLYIIGSIHSDGSCGQIGGWNETSQQSYTKDVVSYGFDYIEQKNN